MKPGHRLHQAQTQSVARRITALLETEEALEHLLSGFFGNTRSTVDDADPRPGGIVFQTDMNVAASWCVLDGVVEQIGQGLEKQIPVPAHLHIFQYGNIQLLILVLGEGLVKLGNVAHDLVEGDVREGRPAPAGFDIGDAQQRVERGQQSISIRQRRFDPALVDVVVVITL